MCIDLTNSWGVPQCKSQLLVNVRYMLTPVIIAQTVEQYSRKYVICQDRFLFDILVYTFVFEYIDTVSDSQSIMAFICNFNTVHGQIPE